MRFGFLIATVAALLGIAGAPAARAGLIGDGTNTVSAFFYINAPATPSGGGCDQSTESFCEQQFNLSSGMAQYVLTIPAHFDQAAISGSTTDVGDTQIVITNQIPATFCSDGVSAGSACTDPFTGFEFLFSSGVDITGVSVDSSSDFLPNGTPPHLGLQLLSPTDILVDVTGAAPAIGGNLILDVTTGGVTPVPEPSTWALMLLGFAGLGFAGWRRTAAEST